MDNKASEKPGQPSTAEQLINDLKSNEAVEYDIKCCFDGVNQEVVKGEMYVPSIGITINRRQPGFPTSDNKRALNGTKHVVRKLSEKQLANLQRCKDSYAKFLEVGGFIPTFPTFKWN